MNCPNCQTDNPQGEQFCGACGAELAGAVPTDQNQPMQNSGQTASLTATPAIATLSFDGKDFPLYEGVKFLIAREGTDKCKPNLALTDNPDKPRVSSAPVELSVENGETTVTNRGSVAIQVAVLLDVGQSMNIKPGDMLVMGGGKHIISIT